MKLELKYAQYIHTQHISSLLDIPEAIKVFVYKYGLTENCWIDFKVEGEAKVEVKLSYDTEPLAALFS